MADALKSIVERVNQGLDANGKGKIVEEITKLFKKLPKSTISSTDAEAILKTLGEELLSREDGKELRTAFCNSDNFLRVLFQLLKTFWDCHKGIHRADDGVAFTSHKTYEIALFYLLTLMESKETIKSTVETMMKVSIFNDYVNFLAEHLADDISYHTQEINLEALCRILMFLRKSHVNTVVSFMRKMPKPIKTALEDPSIGPVGLLKSPQPYIFQVNELLNPNIKSVSVKCISLCFGSSQEKSKGSIIPKHTLQEDTWVHMGLYGFDLDLQDSNIIPTIPYDVVRTAEFFKSPEFSVKISLDQFPEIVAGALAVHELDYVSRGEYFLRLSFLDEQNKKRMESTLTQRLKETAEHIAADQRDEENEYTKKMSVILDPLHIPRFDTSPEPLIPDLDEKLAAVQKQAAAEGKPLKGPFVIKDLDEKLARLKSENDSSLWPTAKKSAPAKVPVKPAPPVVKRKIAKPIDSSEDETDAGEITSPDSRYVTKRRPVASRAKPVAQAPAGSLTKQRISPQPKADVQPPPQTLSLAERRVTLSRSKNANDVLTRLSTVKSETVQNLSQTTAPKDVCAISDTDDDKDDNFVSGKKSSTVSEKRRSTTSTNTATTATKARLSSAPGNKRKATPRKPMEPTAPSAESLRKGLNILNTNDDEDDVIVPPDETGSVTPFPDALVGTKKEGGTTGSDPKPIALATVLGSKVASVRGSNEGDNTSQLSTFGLARYGGSVRSKPLTELYPDIDAADRGNDNDSVKQGGDVPLWKLRPSRPAVEVTEESNENVVPIPDAWKQPTASSMTKQTAKADSTKGHKSNTTNKAGSVASKAVDQLWKPSAPVPSGARMRAPVPILDTSAFETMSDDDHADRKTPKPTSTAAKVTKSAKKPLAPGTLAVDTSDKENAGVQKSAKRAVSMPGSGKTTTRKALTPITEKDIEEEKERTTSCLPEVHEERVDHGDFGQFGDDGMAFDSGGGDDGFSHDYSEPLEAPKPASQLIQRDSLEDKENSKSNKATSSKAPPGESMVNAANVSTPRAVTSAIVATKALASTSVAANVPTSKPFAASTDVERRSLGETKSALLSLTAPPKQTVPKMTFGLPSASTGLDPSQRVSMFDKIKRQLSAPNLSATVNASFDSKNGGDTRGTRVHREVASKYSASAGGSEYDASSQPANEYIEPLDAYEPSQQHIEEQFISPETGRGKRGRSGGSGGNARSLLKIDTDSDVDSPSHDHIQMILAQIERLQKSKAERKLKKKVRAAVQTAGAHVQLYLDQWQDYVRAEGAHHSSVFEQHAEREYSAATALLHAMDTDTQSLLADGGNLLSDLVALETEANAVARELTAALRQYKEEEAALRRDLIVRKKRVVEETKAAISAEMRLGKQKAVARSNTGVMFMR